MYRVHLFEELKTLLSPASLRGTRILEIGPKDGLDSRRLASLQPNELVMIDLPEKRPAVDDWRSQITCPHRHIEQNFMYMPREEYAGLGTFDLILANVTARVNAGVKPGMTDAQVLEAQKAEQAKLEKECNEKTGLRCNTITLYAGGESEAANHDRLV